jgi:hypothetical protein
MPGIKALRKLQMGYENVTGGSVAATSMWRGEGTIQNTQEVVHPVEDIGYLSGIDRTYIPALGGELEFSETPATFEQLGYVLEAGVKMIAAPTADGVGSGKIYPYTFPTTGSNTVRTYTLEGGDNQQAERMEYAFVTEFSLSGTMKQPVMMSAKWVGRQVQTATYTGAITPPTVETILFGNGKLYIDAIGGTIGTTVKANTFIGFTLNATTGFTPVFTADGNLYFSFHKQVMPEFTLQVTFEHDGTSVAEKAAWSAQTARKLRLKFEGSTLGTPGTLYSKKALIIDAIGKWETFDKIDENDGNDVVTGTMRIRYDQTASSNGQIIVVNELAALP